MFHVLTLGFPVAVQGHVVWNRLLVVLKITTQSPPPFSLYSLLVQTESLVAGAGLELLILLLLPPKY